MTQNASWIDIEYFFTGACTRCESGFLENVTTGLLSWMPAAAQSNLHSSKAWFNFKSHHIVYLPCKSGLRHCDWFSRMRPLGVTSERLLSLFILSRGLFASNYTETHYLQDGNAVTGSHNFTVCRQPFILLFFFLWLLQKLTQLFITHPYKSTVCSMLGYVEPSSSGRFPLHRVPLVQCRQLSQLPQWGNSTSQLDPLLNHLEGG